MKYPKQAEEQVTLDFAQRYADWRNDVRALFPWHFNEVDEGSRVSCNKGVGVVVRYDFYPDTETFFIVIQVKARQYTFTSWDGITIMEDERGNG